jgi:ribosomal protein S12 methylthiotransferase accessory factor
MNQPIGMPRVFVREIHLTLPECPAYFSVAVPAPDICAIWPNFPLAAMPRGGRMANGRGFSAEACSASCLGEAVELASCCTWGDEPLISASLTELGSLALAPADLCGFSPSQLAARAAWNAEPDVFDWRPAAPAAHRADSLDRGPRRLFRSRTARPR